eukprot:TRINITY_DN77635_c0_g1_i1.p1 TRINITY_DN77635_c0_g1~~TRINITY_DN77635_c0_g1_i1.p1  ORF type:complete len:114 (-),score=22.27 TRINITY_DN77635_c0_g1_i1:75-416(-)
MVRLSANMLHALLAAVGRLVVPACSSVLLLLLLMVGHAEARPRAKGLKNDAASFFDVESPGDLLWRFVKLLIGLSPVLLLIYCVCAKADPEEEEQRRRNGKDFTLSKKGRRLD